MGITESKRYDNFQNLLDLIIQNIKGDCDKNFFINDGKKICDFIESIDNLKVVKLGYNKGHKLIVVYLDLYYRNITWLDFTPLYDEIRHRLVRITGNKITVLPNEEKNIYLDDNPQW